MKHMIKRRTAYMLLSVMILTGTGFAMSSGQLFSSPGYQEDGTAEEQEAVLKNPTYGTINAVANNTVADSEEEESGLTVTIMSQTETGITMTASLDTSKLSITTDSLNGKAYSRVTLNGVSETQESLKPSLPSEKILLELPLSAENVTVSGNMVQTVMRTLAHIPYPTLPPQPSDTADTDGIDYVSLNNLYSGLAEYPEKYAEESGLSELHRTKKYLIVSINPIKYLHQSNSLLVAKQMTVSVSWSNSGNAASASRNLPASSLYVSGLQSGYSDLALNASPVYAGIDVTATSQHAEYLIVTNRELAPSFKRLETLRKLKGYSTRIVCIEDILADPRFKDGDTVSGLNDDAGKLRAYLTWAYENLGTRYCLLGGGRTILPFRYAYTGTSSITDPELDVDAIPSDLYFGEFDCNWERISNPHEQGNKTPDCIYDIAIGRICCKTPEEVENYTDKVEIYELDPGKGQPEYLMNAFVASSYQMIDSYHKYCEKSFKQIYPDLDFYPQNPIRIHTGSWYMNKMKGKHYGYIDLHGHGNPGGVCLRDTIRGLWVRDYGITALDSDTIYLAIEEGNGLDCLNNKDFPAWSHSMSCYTMPFDDYMRRGLTYNFGDSFILGKDYGGVCYFANTREGYISQSSIIQGNFFKRLYRHRILNTYNIGGDMLGISKCKSWSYLILAHNLLGDPLVHIWTRVPANLSKTQLPDPINVIKASFRFLTGTITRKTIAYQDFHPLTEAVNQIECYYNDALIPYFPTVRLKGVTLKGILDIEFMSCLQIGLYKEDGTSESVVFAPGSNSTLRCKDNVYVNKAQFSRNSTVEIISEGLVSLSECELKEGCSVIIKGKSLKIGSNVNIPKNCKFKFEKL